MTDASAQQGGARVVWSCVLDDTPALWRHIIVWLATLMDCAGVRAENIVVHHVTALRPDIRALTERLRVRTVPTPRFDPRSPHSNKISQRATDFGAASRVVLCDVDLAFITRPPVERIEAPIAGKPVDFPNPPIEVLADLFRFAGLALPRETTGAFVDQSGATTFFQSLAGNYNGGFYAIDRAVLHPLGEAWGRWARWLLDRELIPAPWTPHVDQISFCMAVHELGLKSEELDVAWNLPSHVPSRADDPRPFVVHHHGHLDTTLSLLPLRPPRHETPIAAANAAIAAFLRRHEISITPTAP